MREHTAWQDVWSVLDNIRAKRPKDLRELRGSRKRATKHVAGILAKEERTVADACTRRLGGIGIAAFDGLVWDWDEHGSMELRDLVLERLPRRHPHLGVMETAEVMQFFADPDACPPDIAPRLGV